MTLLLPLGLIALASIAVLILIYIIRPNYQLKYISSTYVWRMSLKLKKKSLPVSKLRNILLILCQILFLAACALALAQPALVTGAVIEEREAVAIIDSSASMRAGTEDDTRFRRAVNGALSLASEVFEGNGYFTVIVAGNEPEVVLQMRMRPDGYAALEEELLGLVEDDACSYGDSDIDAAMTMCEEIIVDNPAAEIYLYTDTEYYYEPSAVEVVDVKESGEWNAGILDARAELEDGWYSIYIDIACYGRNAALNLSVSVAGARTSGSGESYTSVALHTLSAVQCNDEQTMTVVFRSGSGEDLPVGDSDNINIFQIDTADRFYAFDEIVISIDEVTSGSSDSYALDNNMAIYGGLKPTLDVLYASNEPNNFVNGALLTMADYYLSSKPVWNVNVTLLDTTTLGTDEKIPTSGYDLYVYEHVMPEVMPTDGVVVLWDPDSAPQGSGIVVGNSQSLITAQNPYGPTMEDAGADNPLFDYIMADRITVSMYTRLISYDPSYEVLATIDGAPAIMTKNEGDSKVVVLTFNIHYSNIAERNDLIFLFYNIFETYIPATVTGNAFSVYESIELNARGDTLTVSGPIEAVFNEFPAQIELSLPGEYTLTQSEFGETIIEHIYVKVPAVESNIYSTEDAFVNPYLAQSDAFAYEDLILWVAVAFVTLLFVEWLLQYKANV